MERSFSGLSEVKAKAACAFDAVRNLLTPRKKYVLEISDDFDALLGQVATRKGIRKGDVIARSLASYYWLQRELAPDAKHGKKHLVIRNDQEILQRINLP